MIQDTHYSIRKKRSHTKDTKDVAMCVMCAKNHDLEQCKAYLTKSVDERSNHLLTKKLCNGCLKPISKPIWQGTAINVKHAKFETKNILFYYMDLS